MQLSNTCLLECLQNRSADQYNKVLNSCAQTRCNNLDFERYVQEGTFLLHNKPALQRGVRLRALAQLAPRFFAEQDYRESRLQALTTTALHRKEKRSSLRSLQRRRATELCLHRPASRSVRGTKHMNTADDAHKTSAVTLGRIMSYCADGGRALELLCFSPILLSRVRMVLVSE